MITILDTSALITFYKLDGIKFLNSIFQEVYIPLEVEKEFLEEKSDQRLRFLLNCFDENTWLKKCQTYSDDIIEILKTDPRIDAGEREAIAQYKQLQVDLGIEDGKINCIIDESAARKVAKYMDIKVNGTLYIMAIMHLNGFIDYHEETKRLKKERRFGDKVIRDALDEAKTNFEKGNIFIYN